MKLYKIEESDLKKSDRTGLATLYLFWLEQGKAEFFRLPLFINEQGKGVLSADAFSRIFFAFAKKAKKASGFTFTAEPEAKNDGENGFTVIRVRRTRDVDEMPNFVDAPKSAVKRESSRLTAEKASAKKAEAKKAEAEQASAWESKAAKALLSHLQGKYKIALKANEATQLETELLQILHSVK